MSAKSQMKSILGYGASKLPWGGQQAVLEATVEKLGTYQVFSSLAKRLNITSALAHGENGAFHGAPAEDNLVFCRYAEIKEWAPEMVKLFKTLFTSSRGTYLDIGAHIGLTVVPIAAGGVTCHAFEPAPRSLAFLRENIVENGVTAQVTAWPVALSDAPGRVRFVLSPVTSGSDCFWAADDGVRGEKSWPVIEVEAVRLDDLIAPNIARPLGVKIDTEGSEPQVFAGGAKLLAAADLIVTEFFPYMMRRLGGNVAAEIDFLRSHFHEGTILVDEYDVPQWRTIAEVTTELDRIWNGLNSGTWDIWGDPKRRIWYDQNHGLACCDVVVRK